MQNKTEFSLDVRWGDMDAIGHVNNAVYLSYYESARMDWFEKRGTMRCFDGSTVPVIVQANCSYRVAVVYPCKLNVTTELQKVGNTSFTFKQTLLDRDSGILYSELVTTCVWIDSVSNKSLPVPEFIRQLLAE
ncbi:MAG: thioesterase family protein [Spongiibacteraceae bacterium]